MKIISKKLAVIFIILVFFSMPSFSSQSINFSFDDIFINSNEKMGVLGIHYEVNSLFNFGGYGAFTGNRGGFFAIGITSGFKHYLSQNVLVDIGLFLGGGGGASAFPGSGKMIRTHCYLGLDLRDYLLLAGFVQNNISEKDCGTAFSLSLKKSISTELFSNKSVYFAPVYCMYIPDDPNMSRGSNYLPPNISLIGIEFIYRRQIEFYTLLGFYGAGSNTVDGYAKVLGGLGYLYPLFSELYLDSKLLLGMSGGGDLNTGGGAIIQPSIGLNYQFDQNFSGYLNIGKIKSFTGNFQATTYTFGLFNSFQLSDFSINLGNKTYFSPNNIQLLGFSLNKKINSNFYVISSTYWAWAGNVGAYAEGCFGVLITKNINNDLCFYNQSEIGVAGGGGMNVGSGFIGETFLGLEYLLLQNLKLNTAVGYMQTFGQNAFSAPSAQLSLKYDLTNQE